MRYAILSDIHGNLEALGAVADECHQQHVGKILCAGDTVGYGANPKECLDFLQKFKVPSVAGNHDWAVGGRLDASYFTDNGKAAIAWIRSNIPFEYFNYLNGLTTVYKNEDVIVTHASLNTPEYFDYLNNITKAPNTFTLMDRPVCFIGHTHVPQIFIQQGENIVYSHTAEVEVIPECKYIVNVGSVGQPRDKNSMASYCIYDTDSGLIQLRRVSYDIVTAQQKILAAGLPKALATRLSLGK
ncbi:hypothetical protein MNBD_UNCLBAC01-10 [hydrothermal vent metagenome]|uniref:Calcineurin-like phosphoesterase domain-containing protein n=1 Tax=hydrothermal vent metagenome TaxID=652676 RepID=A0A3B1DMZ5_9ZZZZ